MTAPAPDLDDILQRLEAARAELTETLKSADPDRFDKDNVDGESVKRTIERTADDLNFYYGRLAARALNLPQPPCLSRAEFSSLREATVSLQVAHRRFSNLLHDLVPGDLDRVASEDDNPQYTLRQVLEMAAAHYKLRAQQVKLLSATTISRRKR
ncbi:MAG: DinB family protein [Chloroflexi bacterium]|nr:MAG: DinB family protein [Chloroflexota bacterium]